MKITYIYHSGFLIETCECYYLFDYYKGNLPSMQTDKPILVFASHSHGDHYNPEIFSLLKEMGMKQITAVLAKDISPRKYPADTELVKAYAHKRYKLPCDTVVETLQSTDAGVAFLLRCKEGILYHAGDLNDWCWSGESLQYNKQMTGSYRHEINLLKDMLGEDTIDAAFLPLDPRQEQNYAKGMLYFLQNICVKKVCPMHYWDRPEIIDKFLTENPDFRSLMLL